MKKVKLSKGIYDEAVTIENIYSMWQIIKKTCKNKKGLFYFSLNLNTNINYIYNLLKNRSYKPGRYHAFMIFEPKPRLVMSQSIHDKVVNHFVANYFLLPYLENTLINSNVATRKNMGSSYAMKLLKSYFNKILINNKYCEVYCLKIDISKYFYSIDHSILLEKLKKKILDPDVIFLIKTIIYETNSDYVNDAITKYNRIYDTNIPLYRMNKGLSIGAMSSQFLAIFYLSDLDHFIKEKLGCKYYIRYMDDFLILDIDKDRLKKYWTLINEEIRKLNLITNKKSNIYRSSRGFSFLGYKYVISNNKLKILYNKKTFYRIKKKLDMLYLNDKVKYKKTLASYYGYFMNGDIRFKKVSFEMKSIDVYNSFKENYKSSLVILKDGIFYKCFDSDAKILWYLFSYKYVNNSVSFGNIPYDKVISKLRSLDLGFVVIDNKQEILSSVGDVDIYKSYLNISTKTFEKYERKKALIEKLSMLLDKKSDCYLKIDTFLDELLEE